MSVQSEAASELMAERARLTLGVLEARWREFAEFEVVPLVKLGSRRPTTAVSISGSSCTRSTAIGSMRRW